MTFQTFKNKQTGEEVEAYPEELAIMGSNQWHVYWHIKGDLGLVPDKEFQGKFKKVKNDKAK